MAFAPGDTVFNESFATAVERLGAERWLALNGSEASRSDYALSERRREAFRSLTLSYRDQLQALYASPASEADKRAGKARLLAAMRADYAAMKAGPWGGYAGYDGWFARANNAYFGVLAAYNGLAPQFERLHARRGGDFQAFYAEVKRLAALPLAERRAGLAAASGTTVAGPAL